MLKSAVVILKTASVFLIVAAVFLTACRRSAKTDLRKLVPSDALVYLETDDVAETLQSLVVSPAFQTLAADEPNFSALKNTQTAVVVSGFETAEENLVLNLKPHFVVVVETHLWSWQTVALVENALGKFVKKGYGETAKLAVIDKNDGRFFTWTAQDNRQIFAFARGSLIYFGNDAAGIEKCLKAAAGETENLTQNESFVRRYSENNLAFGYVSAEGIKQIAQLAGVSIAVNATEEADGRNFVARVVPQILGNTTEEVIWTANRAERGGIEDKFSVKLKPETAAVVKEILDASDIQPTLTTDFLPPDVFSATVYNLKNPSLAWRGALLLTAKNTDASSGKILLGFAGKLLEPYAVGDAETFLSAIDAPVLTAQFDADGEKSVTMATIKDLEKLKSSISKE
ncbi:MAG: hypothetical protein M3T96_01590, partial [Acidobacteriota bacterium]|nr:hypothetical protein [Acidobacteriota bacterium]